MVAGTTFKGFKGMDNIHEDIELPPELLRRAVNTDVLDSGLLRRRKGFSQSLAVSMPHSMWGNGEVAYFIAANELRRFFPGGTSASLGAFLAGTNRAAYQPANGSIHVTCKTARGKITSGVLDSWGIDNPTSTPVLAATVGNLPAGTYYAAATFLLADGRESGSSDLSSIVLAAPGGIATTGMPNSADVNVTKKRLYLTTPDGEVLYMAVEMGATDQFVSLGTLPAGAKLRTQHLSPPPFGKALEHYNGRIFIVDATDPRILWYTEPLDYDHVNLRKNYYKFPEPITMIAVADDGVMFARNGLFVCSDRTCFMPEAGEDKAEMRVVSELSAVEGSLANIINTSNPIWMTANGPCIGKHSGEVELIAEKTIASGTMQEAAGMVREKDGLKQYVVVGTSLQDAGLISTSYAEAEIVRRST